MTKEDNNSFENTTTNTDRNLFVQNKDTLDPLLAVSRVSAAISGLEDLNAILKIGLDTTLNCMNGITGGIMLLDEENQVLNYRVTRGLSSRFSEEMKMKLGEGIAGKVAQNGETMLVDDMSEESEAVRHDLIFSEGIKSFLSVPLKVKGKVLGVMNCASQNPCSFAQAEAHLLKSIGDQLGIAIEQAKLKERLRKSREMYKQMARKILETQEEERKMMSRELHDGTSQILAGLSLNMQALMDMAKSIGIEDPKFLDILKKSHDASVQMHNEVSKLIEDLRPTQLDTLGLTAAVRQYVKFKVASQGIKLHLDLDPVEKFLDPEVALNLFRWIQGAVGNVIEHSQADAMEVQIKQQEANLMLRVSDNGQGFDSDALPQMRERGRGYGLLNVKERIKQIGGVCTIRSKPGEGTTATAYIPLYGVQ